MKARGDSCGLDAGTASKTLAPGLRLGWLVVPGHLVDDVSEAKTLADRGSPSLAFNDGVTLLAYEPANARA